MQMDLVRVDFLLFHERITSSKVKGRGIVGGKGLSYTIYNVQCSVFNFKSQMLRNISIQIYFTIHRLFRYNE